MTFWLEDNDIEMYSTCNKEKSVEFMTQTIDKLDDIVNKQNNTYNSTIKMEPIDVKSSIYIGFDKKNNKKYPKFKIGDYVRILKYKNIFAKGYISNWSEEVFVIKEVNNTVPWTYVINYLNGE